MSFQKENYSNFKLKSLVKIILIIANENISFFSDRHSIEKYIIDRQNSIVEISKNPSQLKSLIETKIEELFKSNFKIISNEIMNKCRDMRDMEKRKTWMRFKKWMFLNRVMEYKSKQKKIQYERLSALGQKLIFFPEDNSKTFREMQHPELKKSAFYDLVNLFDIKDLTPEYAAKFAYTTKKK